jgi:Tat protein translocase TatB subunit
MFDITSSKLLLLGIVALIVIGPKDLPVLLRTIGKYVGMIKRQAAEFRAQFDEAMRESELDQLKKDVESMAREAETSMREAEQNVTKELDAAKSESEKAIEHSIGGKSDFDTHYADGTPIAGSSEQKDAVNGANGAVPHDDGGTKREAEAAPAEQKTGA